MEIAAVVSVGQPLVIEAQEMEHRCVQIVDAHFIDDRLVADFVGLTVVKAIGKRVNCC